MAKVEYHNVWNNAKQTRLVSGIPAYSYQILYHIPKCKGHYETKGPNGVLQVHLCTAEHMQWRGEFGDGTFTQFFDIEPAQFAAWLKRTESDKARPEAQMTGEYSQRIKRPGLQVLDYLKTLDAARQWWKGERVEA